MLARTVCAVWDAPGRKECAAKALEYSTISRAVSKHFLCITTMPASPDRRVVHSRSTKKVATSASPSGGLTLSKSASESSLKKKKQQGGLLEQELLLLERDEGKRHARELSACLLDYAKKIEDLQEKNRRLEEEVCVLRMQLYDSPL